MARRINDIEKDLLALPREEWSRIALDLIRNLDKDDEPLSRELKESKPFTPGPRCCGTIVTVLLSGFLRRLPRKVRP